MYVETNKRISTIHFTTDYSYNNKPVFRKSYSGLRSVIFSTNTEQKIQSCTLWLHKYSRQARGIPQEGCGTLDRPLKFASNFAYADLKTLLPTLSSLNMQPVEG